jgi:hypothetical protein
MTHRGEVEPVIVFALVSSWEVISFRKQPESLFRRRTTDRCMHNESANLRLERIGFDMMTQFLQ